MFNLKHAVSAMIFGATALHAAHAGPAPDVVSIGNQWTITFYDDSSPSHTQWATQTLCFYTTGTVGTQLAGIWYSPTFYDWNGSWRQEGDQVFMTGDYAGDVAGNAVGHDGMQWEIVTADKNNEGYGHWKEWRENGGFGNIIGFGNAKFVRTGRCMFLPPLTADIPTIEKYTASESLKAPRRFRRDGKDAVGPIDATLVPLAQ